MASRSSFSDDDRAAGVGQAEIRIEVARGGDSRHADLLSRLQDDRVARVGNVIAHLAGVHDRAGRWRGAGGGDHDGSHRATATTARTTTKGIDRQVRTSRERYKCGSRPSESAREPVGAVVGTTGLEPGTSTVSWWRSNQLSYAPSRRAKLPGDQRRRTATSLASSRPGLVSTQRSPRGSTRPVEARHRRVHRAARRLSCAATVATPRAGGSRHPTSRRRPPSADRPRRRRCSAPACARSTSAARRRGSGPRSRSRGSRAGASRAGCAGTHGPVAPSWTPRSSTSPAAVSSSSASSYSSAWMSSSGYRAGSAASGVPGSTVRP